MRIVGGEARGRRLVAPKGDATRPTSDFVREAIFNVLGGFLDLDGAHVVDLFCGTGAIGLEALSRGAASATFVDKDRLAVAATHTNVDHLGDGFGTATIVRSDVLTWLRRRPPGLAAADVVFADPPYDFAAWPDLLDAIGDVPLAVLESDREPTLPPPWEVARTKRYGGTVVTFAQRPGRADHQAKGAS